MSPATTTITWSSYAWPCRMSERRRFLKREDLALAVWSLVLGLAGACVFAVYRAVSLSDEDAAGRIAELAASLLFPGSIIFVAVAAVVFGGWKANLD